MHILYYNTAFLSDKDSFNFIIFKRLYYTSFTLNIINFSSALTPGHPQSTEGLKVCPDPQLRFVFQFMQNAEFFSFLAKTLINICFEFDTLVHAMHSF